MHGARLMPREVLWKDTGPEPSGSCLIMFQGCETVAEWRQAPNKTLAPLTRNNGHRPDKNNQGQLCCSKAEISRTEYKISWDIQTVLPEAYNLFKLFMHDQHHVPTRSASHKAQDTSLKLCFSQSIGGGRV